MITSAVTSKFGSVSSICGVVYGAGAGILAGILYLKNELELFHGAYKDYAGGVAGIFCDGAKGSCAMKAATAYYMAQKAIQFAENNFVMSDMDGYLEDSFLTTVKNLQKYDKHFKKFDLETIKILEEKAK